MVTFMDRYFLNKISLIIKDREVWEAFIAIIEFEETRVLKELIGERTPEQLLRTSAKYSLLQHLKKVRENAIRAEQEFNPSST